jgi:hypothetical protein
MLLSDVIAGKIEYNMTPYQNARWQDIFARTKVHIQNIEEDQNALDERIQKNKKIK